MELSLGGWRPHPDWRQDAAGLWRLADPWGLAGAGTGLTAEVTEQDDRWEYSVQDSAPHQGPDQDTAKFLAEAELVLAVRDF